jgi:AraC-like DNA-binding protein
MVGCGRPIEPVPGLLFVRATWGEALSLGLDGWKVLVLGDRVLTSVAPKDVRKLIGARAVRVIVSPDECDCRELTRWVQAGFQDLVLPENLVEYLIERECSVSERPDLELQDWLPFDPDRSSAGQEAAKAVPSLVRPFAVSEWSEALGWCRQKLWRVCAADFGTNPKTVLWWYIGTVVCKARAQGQNTEQISSMLGYADSSTLSHAFQGRARAIPAKAHSCGYECRMCPLHVSLPVEPGGGFRVFAKASHTAGPGSLIAAGARGRTKHQPNGNIPTLFESPDRTTFT